MRVVAEQERLAPPALCFICESSPLRDPERDYQEVVDTQRDFNPPSLSHLSGRKYICERCVREAANLLGLFDADELSTADEALKQARKAVGDLTDFVASLAGEAADRLKEVADLLPDGRLVRTPRDENVKKETDNGA